MDITALQLTILILCALLVGFSKTGMPTLGLFTAALLALVFPTRESVGLLTPILITGDIIAILYYRKAVIWKHLLVLLPWVLLGLLAGYFVLGRIDNEGLSVMLGMIILALCVLQIYKNRIEARLGILFSRSQTFNGSLGVLSGFTTMVGNAAGSIMSIYLLAKGMNKLAFMGTGAFFFFIVNVIKVPFTAQLGLINSDTLTLNAWMIPFVAIGAYVGIKVLPLIPQKHFQNIVLALAALGGLNLILL